MREIPSFRIIDPDCGNAFADGGDEGFMVWKRKVRDI